jgi:hypothetical protein
VGAVEIVGVASAGLAVAGSSGAFARWVVQEFKRQGLRLAKVEGEYATLYREHSLVLVRLERFRLAFQMVASELSRKSPGNIALVHAKALLDDAFTVEPDLPEDLKALIRKLDGQTADR